MRTLTWIQASWTLHIWNYFWAMKQMVDVQNSKKDWDEIFMMIADMHSLTSLNKSWDAKILRENVKNTILDYLAVWLDPEKVILYVQSDIPEVTELYWYLSPITWMWMLWQAHSYKDKVANWVSPNHALFSYPVLMAADILIVKADKVPVWKDQIQHLEMTRDIAKKFNSTYCEEWNEVFIIPEAKVQEELKTIPGLDWQKMSKSYWNTIPLFWTENEIKKKVMSISTDSKTVEDKKNPEECNVFALYKLVSSEKEIEEMRQNYLNWNYWYWDAKKALFENMKKYFWAMWEKRKELEEKCKNDKNFLAEIRKIWEEKMRRHAMKVLEKVRRKAWVR